MAKPRQQSANFGERLADRQQAETDAHNARLRQLAGHAGSIGLGVGLRPQLVGWNIQQALRDAQTGNVLGSPDDVVKARKREQFREAALVAPALAAELSRRGVLPDAQVTQKQKRADVGRISFRKKHSGASVDTVDIGAGWVVFSHEFKAREIKHKREVVLLESGRLAMRKEVDQSGSGEMMFAGFLDTAGVFDELPTGLALDTLVPQEAANNMFSDLSNSRADYQAQAGRAGGHLSLDPVEMRQVFLVDQLDQGLTGLAIANNL